MATILRGRISLQLKISASYLSILLGVVEHLPEGIGDDGPGDARHVHVGQDLAKEYDLIELLMKNPRRVYSRENLMNVVWGYSYTGGPTALPTSRVS